jgi:1-acyl-sn-glycerol-3-phosphate acyltransferase
MNFDYIKHRKWAIAVPLIVLGISMAFMHRFSLEEDITAMLPETDTVIQDFRLVVKRFQALDALYIDIGTESDQTESADYVVLAADSFYKALKQSGLFSSIDYQYLPEELVEFYNTLSERKALLIGASELSQFAKILDPEEIERRLNSAKRKFIEPSGFFIREQILEDPLEFSELIFSKIQCLSPGANSAQLIDGRIWSKDSKHLLMIAIPSFPATDSKRGEHLIAVVDNIRQEVLKLVPAGMVRISYVGGHRATLDNARTIKSDLSRLTTVASIGIAVICILFFRRISYVLLIFLPMVLGIACAALAFAVFEPSISGISLGCAIILMGIVVDNGIYFLYRWDNIEEQTETPTKTVRSMLIPLLIGAGTTVVGFLCFMVSSIPGTRQMGIFGALGTTFSTLFAIFLLPRLVVSPSSWKVRHGIFSLTDYCHRFLIWRQHHSKAFILATVAILAVGIAGLWWLRFEGDPQELNYVPKESLEDEQAVLDVWGDFSTSSVVVQGRTLEEALRKNDHLAELLQRLLTSGKIASFSSIAGILPSHDKQMQNQKRWQEFWKSNEGTVFLDCFEQKATQIGFKHGAFESFYRTLRDECEPIEITSFPQSGPGRLVHRYIASDRGDFFVLSTVEITDINDLPSVSSLISNGVDDAIVMDKRAFVEHCTSLVKSEFKKFSVVVCLAMMAFMLLFLRIELVLAVMLPVFYSIVITLGLLGFLGININLVSCLFIVFIFGVGSDYSIFLACIALDFYLGQRKYQLVTLGAVVICALTTICSLGVLVLARHQVLFFLGAAGLIGIICSLIAAVLIVPIITSHLFPAETRHGAPTLRKILAAILSYIYVGLAALFYLSFLKCLVKLWYKNRRFEQQRFVRRYFHYVARGLINWFPFRGTSCVYINCDRQAFPRASVIVSNHLSAFDIMVVLSLPVDLVMMVKQWVWRKPIVGSIIREAGYILVEDNVELLLSKAASYLERNISVMVFPEGGRSRDGKMGRFHKGAFELAIRTQSDIIPLLITDSQSCLAPETYYVGYSKTIVQALPPVTAENCDYSIGPQSLATRVKTMMQALEHQNWRISQQGRPFWCNIRSAYDYLGRYVESYVAWKLRLDPIHRSIDELVPEEGLVLDLGCGYGLMTNILARKSRHRYVIGMDYDTRKIAVAKQSGRLNQNAEFQLSNLFDAQYPQAECVVLVDVLHYWPLEKQLLIISKACGCLKDDGILVFRDGLYSSTLQHQLVKWTEYIACLIGHNRRGEGLFFYERDVYANAFDRHGLQLIKEYEHLGHGSNTVLVCRKKSDGL